MVLWTACIWAVHAAIGVLVVAGTQKGRYVGCEGDGHFLRAGYLKCGDVALFQHFTGEWPWLYPWLTAQLSRAIDDTYLAGRLVSVAAMATMSSTVFATAWTRWRSVQLASVATGVVATTPQLLYYGTLASTDVLAASMVTLSIPFGLSALRGGHVARDALLAGVFGALATQVRYPLFPQVVVYGVVLCIAVGRGQRAAAATAFGTGLLGVLAACQQLPWARSGEWGGVAVAWATARRVTQGTMSTADIAERLGHAAALAAWHVDYMPLIGLVVLAVAGRRTVLARREAWLLLAPLAVELVAVGRMVSVDDVERGRLFLPMLPVAALGSGIAWRALRSWEGARMRVSALAVAAFVALTVNQTFAAFPMPRRFAGGVPVPGLGFSSPQRVWDVDVPDDVDPTARVPASLAAFVADHDLGCSPVITNSTLASTFLPVAILAATVTSDALDHARVDDVVRHTPTQTGIRWVLEAPRDGVYALDPTDRIGCRHELALVARPAPEGMRLYELVTVAEPGIEPPPRP